MKLNNIKKISKSKNAILIEGLPGIGNVGKIAADYMIDSLNAKQIATISSDYFPNLVIVTEENLVEMPVLELWHKKISERDFFFLIGDFQPNSEEGSFKLSEFIIDFCKKQGISEILTLGGIGLELVDDDPEVYATANNKKVLSRLKKAKANTKVYGKVGTIIGVTGLLLGLPGEEISSSALLVETSFEPGITAIISAKKLLETISKFCKVKISLKELDEKFVEIENKHLSEVEKMEKVSKVEETNYIG